MSIWAVGLLLIPVILLFAGGGLIGAVVVFGSGSGSSAQPQPVTAPTPSPSPPPSPPPRPPTPSGSSSVVRVQFQSEPSGAEIWEQDRILCTTPCLVDHPDYAPPERHFVLKHPNHPDTDYVMKDPTIVQQVPLASKGKGGRPKPRPSEDILIQR